MQNDKQLLEECIEKEPFDKGIKEKYSVIKNFFEKYLELINDKLVENIEHNMILKFNMKEILELNNTNNTHVNKILFYLYKIKSLEF